MEAPQGAFPAETTMKVKYVSKSDVIDAVESVIDDVEKLRAVDITFYNKDGEEIQPKKRVDVTFTSAAFDGNADLSVVHINDDGDANVIQSAEFTDTADGAQTEFKTKGFSVYVVVETIVPRLTLTFVNGDTPSPTMIVKDADTLEEVEDIIYDPGVVGLAPNEVFRGWTTEQNYTKDTELLSIAEVRSAAISTADAITEDTEVTYYPAIFKQYKINYIDEGGVSQGADTVEIPRYETEGTYTVNMGYTPADAEHNFEGWLVQRNRQGFRILHYA